MPYAAWDLLLKTLETRTESLSVVSFIFPLFYIQHENRENSYITHCRSKSAVKAQVYQRFDHSKFPWKI